MRVDKRVFADIPMLYAVSLYEENGETKVLYASEKKDGPCVLVSIPDMKAETVWTTPGGVMSLIPDRKAGGFWAIQKFFPIFDSMKAEIIYAHRNGSGLWETQVRGSLPYVHRIALLNIGGHQFLMACTLCAKKEFTDDWSTSGAVYIAKILGEGDATLEFEPVLNGITKNHGLFIKASEESVCALVSGVQGVFEITFRYNQSLEWKVNRLIDRETSEAAWFDIDGDGEKELLTIEGFHGDQFNIYRNSVDDWQQVYSYDISFGHVLWAGSILGRDGVIISDRGNEKSLYALFYNSEGSGFEKVVIDNGVGATQIDVINSDGQTLIFAADHASAQAAAYLLTA